MASIGSPLEETQKARTSSTLDVVDSSGDVGQYSSLALLGGSTPFISYYNATGGQLKVAMWSVFSWTTFTPFGQYTDDIGSYSSAVACNTTGGVSVSYYDATNHRLLYADSYGQSIVDSAGDVGQYSSIAVNSVTNTIAISYYDATNGNLKVAVNASGSGWVITTVDSAAANVGLYSNLIFMGTNDSMCVLYYDATNGDLKNAWQFGGSGPWNTVVIDSTGDVGKWPSQFVIGDNFWVSSYYDQTNGNLKYMSSIGSTIDSSTPDSIGNVGQYSSIGVNSTGHVFISYYDVTNGNLKLAWNDSATWQNTTLDSTGDVGQYTSLKIDPNNAIHISYYDATNQSLRYVKDTSFGSTHTGISFSPPHSDSGNDTNANGLYDWLDVDVVVDVTAAGWYNIYSGLNEAYGNSTIDYASSYSYLNTGIQTVTLQFSGIDIYNHGYSGTFDVDLSLYDDYYNWLDSDNYTTAAYLYTDFEQPGASFAPPHSDSGNDTNANGLYDSLNVDVVVDVATAGWYNIYGYLYGGNFSWIDYASSYSYLNTGIQTVTLQFSGKDIYNYGYSGSFDINLNLYDDSWNLLDSDTHTTAAYLYTDFEQSGGPGSAIFSPPHSEYVSDTNANGLYDWLDVDVVVDVATAGWYNIYGSLYAGNFSYLDYASSYSYLNVGIQTVNLQFSGINIYKEGYNGTFDVDLNLVDGSYIWLDSDNYTTAAYLYTDFEQPSHFESPSTDFGADTNGSALFEYLVVNTTVDIKVAGTYTVIGAVSMTNMTPFAVVVNTTYLGVGIHLVQLWFTAGSIISYGVDGAYSLMTVLLDGMSIIIDQNVTLTNPYTIGQFQVPPAMLEPYYTYYGEDTNANGLFDYLVVNVTVNVTTSGWYTVAGDLSVMLNSTDTASNYTYLTPGVHTVQLRFNGTHISANGLGGQYLVFLSLYDNSSTLISTGFDTTNTYAVAQFETSSAPLSATGTVNATSGTAPLLVSFTCAPTGGKGPYTYSWTFGDGGTSAQRNPGYVYSIGGTFTAIVTVTDSASHTAQWSSATITVTGVVSVAGTASPTSGAAPLPVSFTCAPTGGTGPYTYAWTFGDGQTSTSQNPSHTYTAVGTYTAKVKVTDSASHSTIWASSTITVTAAPITLTVTGTVNATSGTAPLSVSFTCTPTGGTGPYTYSWDFGDGQTSTSQNASHTYNSVGVYTATLTVTDSDSNTAQWSTVITVTSSSTIPEFSDVIIPIVGLMLIALVFGRTRKHREERV